MIHHFAARSTLLAAVLASGFVGCNVTFPIGDPLPYNETDTMPEPDTGSGSGAGPVWCGTMPACDATLTVDPSGPAMIVTDPAVLAQFPLERVVQQILDFQGASSPPGELMQRFFDTMNSDAGAKFTDVLHCDSAGNPATQFGKGDSLICPRAEGQLAFSDDLFTAGHPDSFFPIAIVNRFDLTPLDGSRCGQYRIVYAKQSGLTDPNNRVFLIFEAALPSPNAGCLDACMPVAQFWKGLEGQSTETISSELQRFFFEGLDGVMPAVNPLSYGLGSGDEGYGATEGGQVRVSMHMEDPWDMREMHFGQDDSTGAATFVPTTVKNNPAAAYFDAQASVDNGMGPAFRDDFVQNAVDPLSSPALASMQMFVSSQFNGAESVLGGAKKNDYVTAATQGSNTTFVQAIQSRIDDLGLGNGCLPDDPLDADAVLRRASVLSCAGCHAPKEMIGEDRSLGCGLVWPDSIGQAHITEQGELSPALKELFLPHRAAVMQGYLQACDLDAIANGFQAPAGQVKKLVAGGAPQPVRTLGGSQSH